MVYILILTFSTVSGAFVHSIEFSTKDKCEIAGSNWFVMQTKDASGNDGLIMDPRKSYICVKK